MNANPLIQADESWLNAKWRPAMAWTYMAICVFDFIIAPIINYVFFGRIGGDFISWKPLTMSDGGLFHLAMGAVLGITAWTRGNEKITRIRMNHYDFDDEEPTSIQDSSKRIERRRNDGYRYEHKYE